MGLITETYHNGRLPNQLLEGKLTSAISHIGPWSNTEKHDSKEHHDDEAKNADCPLEAHSSHKLSQYDW